MTVPYDQGRPIWIDDDRFDITYHVRHTALPKPGSWEQLVALTTRVQENLLDRERPLWELWFVEGLEDGHVALIQKTHHSLDRRCVGRRRRDACCSTRRPITSPPVPHEWTPEPAPAPSQLLLDTLRERATEPAELVRSVRSMCAVPRHAVEQRERARRSMSTMVNRDSIAPRTSINARTGRHRLLSVVRIPLADVKAIRKALGGTVNDVVLAGVGGGLNRLLDPRGDDVEDLRLRVLCPVSVRSDDQRRRARQQDLRDLRVAAGRTGRTRVDRLHEISAQTADLKEKRQALSADLLLNMSDYVAPTLMSLAGARRAPPAVREPDRHQRSRPAEPLYLMGARLLEAFPIVPLTQNLTVVVGILSYDGTLHFGLWADRDAAGRSRGAGGRHRRRVRRDGEGRQPSGGSR